MLPFILIQCLASSFALHMALAQEVPPASLAAQYSLTTSTSMPFPTATLSITEAQSFLNSQWGLNKGHIQDGGSDIAFVDDPFPGTSPAGITGDNSTGPVLEVTYDAGSTDFQNSQATPGGAQSYSLWNSSDGSAFQSMMLTYEVAFDPDFEWVKGGKLPGLRGGPNITGCDGGDEPTGSDCFSTRLMWRAAGSGEVYAYMETPNNLCSQPNIICNSDFGISLSRNSFIFTSGGWNRVTLLVQLNSPVDIANGNVILYYNDLLALQHSNLQLRTSTSVDIGGLFFSTFYGGSDPSWAPSNTTHSYFRNMMLWGGSSPSNLTGSKVSAAGRVSQPLAIGLGCLIVALIFFY